MGALGSALGVATGLWAAYVSYFVDPSPLCSSCSTPGTLHNSDPWLGIVGAILVLASVVGLAGVRRSFTLGAVLSAVLIARVALLWGSYPFTDEVAVVVLSAITLVAEAVASLPSKGLSEKDSPLNLPVFG
jgi:hypothetical protein